MLRVGLKHKKLRISIDDGDFAFAVFAYPSGKCALKRINGDNGFARTGSLHRLPDQHVPFRGVGVMF